MNIFKNLSIKRRFFILFFICITAFISFGTFALIELNNLAQVTDNIYNQPLKVSNAAREARVNVIKIHRAMKDVILASSSDEVQRQVNVANQLESDALKDLDTLEESSIDKETKKNLNDIKNILAEWKQGRQEIIDEVLKGKSAEAEKISTGKNAAYVEQIEASLSNIDKYSSENARSLIDESHKMQSSEKTALILTLVILLSILIVAFALMVINVLKPISRLKNHMIRISNTEKLEEFEIDQKSEISEMAKCYNVLLNKLKKEFWLNDARNSLNDEMDGNMPVKELTQKVLNYLARALDAGNGAFYIYNHKEKKVFLNSSFAFTERERLSNIYELGEGIVGQVALERKPILLTNVRKSEAAICTATIYEAPLNVYAFPLIYEEKLYGVVELASFEPFDNLKQQFIKVASKIIAINLYSTIQNQKIKELLEISEKATKEATEISDQLKGANEVLEEQQRQLQVQTEELQQTNAQLEEQQQMLQQQSEEMQLTNTQLEEHQLQLEEQSRQLSIKNDELEKSEKEILARSKDYERANKYKSQFLANISHELRTPLNSIILLSNLLMRRSKDTLEQSAQEKIKVIYNSGQHLNGLINEILDLSKIEAGKMDLNYRYFNSSELIEELSEIFDVTAKEKDIQFILEDEFKDNLYGDKERISQVLRNFLSNAFKFTEKGSVRLKIARDYQCENNIMFLVADTGIGISKDNLDIIFEEFHQGDGSISRKYGGTGLGLSISNKLCELMKGEIKVNSELGIGSAFFLYLPLTVLEQDLFKQEAVASISNELQSIEKEQAKKIKNKKQKTLLIVEDDKNLVESIKAISEGIGFVTLTANSGAEGLKLIEEHKIHGIVLDLGLPDINGIDLLKEIRKDINLNIPVIVYTGMRVSAEEEKEIKLYADSIIIKTTNSDERLLDELTLVLHKVNNEEEYKSIMTSKINKDKALKLDNKKILIVDDDPRNIFVLAAALEDYGAEIIEAENGKVALEKLENEVVDLVLMDIMMPVMDGYETIKNIRNRDEIKHIPIIATTAKSLKDDREKCMAAGANDYISKPIEYNVLITLIKAWINKS